jgi:hypothetical protein
MSAHPGTHGMNQPTEPRTHPVAAPENLLFILIVNLLAPMLLAAAMGDITLARAAAIETVNSDRARSQTDLLAIAQVVAFGLAALDSLSRSMGDDISITMALRLRGNANACNRASEQNRRALAKAQAEIDLPETDLPAPEAAPPLAKPSPFLSDAAEAMLAEEARARPHPLPQTPAPPDHATKAADLLRQVGELKARIPSMSKSARKAAFERITRLTATARMLTSRPAPNPA